MLCYIFILIWIVYSVFIIKYINKMIYKDCKFTEIVDDNIKEEYKPF